MVAFIATIIADKVEKMNNGWKQYLSLLSNIIKQTMENHVDQC